MNRNYVFLIIIIFFLILCWLWLYAKNKVKPSQIIENKDTKDFEIFNFYNFFNSSCKLESFITLVLIFISIFLVTGVELERMNNSNLFLNSEEIFCYYPTASKQVVAESSKIVCFSSKNLLLSSFTYMNKYSPYIQGKLEIEKLNLNEDKSKKIINRSIDDVKKKNNSAYLLYFPRSKGIYTINYEEIALANIRIVSFDMFVEIDQNLNNEKFLIVFGAFAAFGGVIIFLRECFGMFKFYE